MLCFSSTSWAQASLLTIEAPRRTVFLTLSPLTVKNLCERPALPLARRISADLDLAYKPPPVFNGLQSW